MEMCIEQEQGIIYIMEELPKQMGITTKKSNRQLKLCYNGRTNQANGDKI
jgi:hypothetical protein